MRIDLRGVIVPSFYDSEWTQEYIDKGLMMPESTFRRQLAEAKTDEPLNVYVNSPGGSVFAAYEMINAVREWKADTGQPANITIGAMAASAASAFAVMAGSSVKAHRNAKMMFHGATTEAWGGKEALEDEAELIGKINADIQNTLINKYDMDPDTVAEWFAEGRQGWLNADEMVDAGIASEIIGDDADVIQFDQESVEAINGHGLKIAALIEMDENTEEEEEEELVEEDEQDEWEDWEEDSESNEADESDENSADDDSEEEAEEPDSENTGSDTGDDSDEAAAEPSPEYFRGVSDGMSQGRAELMLEYEERIRAFEHDLSVAKAESQRYQADRDKLAHKLKETEAESKARTEAIQTKLDEATERIRKHIDGAMRFEPEPMTWEQAIKECGGYPQAKAKYPELCENFKTQRGARK